MHAIEQVQTDGGGETAGGEGQRGGVACPEVDPLGVRELDLEIALLEHQPDTAQRVTHAARAQHARRQSQHGEVHVDSEHEPVVGGGEVEAAATDATAGLQHRPRRQRAAGFQRLFEDRADGAGWRAILGDAAGIEVAVVVVGVVREVLAGDNIGRPRATAVGQHALGQLAQVIARVDDADVGRHVGADVGDDQRYAVDDRVLAQAQPRRALQQAFDDVPVTLGGDAAQGQRAVGPAGEPADRADGREPLEMPAPQALVSRPARWGSRAA